MFTEATRSNRRQRIYGEREEELVDLDFSDPCSVSVVHSDDLAGRVGRKAPRSSAEQRFQNISDGNLNINHSSRFGAVSKNFSVKLVQIKVSSRSSG